MLVLKDQTEEAKDLLLSEYNNSPTLQALLESWVHPCQDFEQSLIDFVNGNGISVATGTMLDTIATWFGLERELRTDAELRTAILARAILSGMDGTTRNFIRGGQIICNTYFFTFYDYYPATAYVHVGEGYTNATIEELRRIKPAGVELRMLVDVKFDSFSFSDVIALDNSLITGTQEDYLVVVDGETHVLIVSSSTNEVLDARGDYFSESFESDGAFLSELVVEKAKAVNNTLVDDQGNTITDVNGTPFTVIEYEY